MDATNATARIITDETDPDYGPRYAVKHADGRDSYEQSYSVELLWADWQAGRIEFTAF